jgi:hypothetical protein
MRLGLEHTTTGVDTNSYLGMRTYGGREFLVGL